MYLQYKACCLVVGRKRSERNEIDCASTSLLHRRVGRFTMRNYLLRHHSSNRVLAAQVGTKVEAVSCRVDRFCARMS